MNLELTRPEHEIVYQELCEFVDEHAARHNLTTIELLAIAANMLGKMSALLEQVVEPSSVREIISSNMAMGRQQALTEVNHNEH